MPKRETEKPIGQIHIKWYQGDRKLIAAIKQTAKQADRNFSQQVKALLRQATEEQNNGARC